MAFWQKGNDLKRRAEWLASQSFVLLSLQIPKDNEKTSQSAEQFFAALHGIFRSDPIIQEHISFEIAAEKDSIIFYVLTPIHLREFIEGQLYAQYPDLVITKVSDYVKEVPLDGLHVATTDIKFSKEDVYPIKTYKDLELDPLASLSAVMSVLEPREHVWFQMVTRPIGDEWQARGVKVVQAVRSGASPPGLGFASKVGRFAVRVTKEVMQPGSGLDDGKSTTSEAPKLSAPEEAALKGIEGKITKLGFETLFRVVVISPEVPMARSRTQAVLAALKQYNTTNLNSFIGGEIKVDDYATWEKFINREFEEQGNVLNIEELASVYHFPTKSVETNAISWAGSKKGEAPFNLPLKEAVDPLNLTVIGRTDFRNNSKEFGIKMDDRKRHMYVIGKSGTGKSTLLENMIIDDIVEGRGVIVVDPHGELADKIIDSIPANRIKDVVILDPSDREFPVSFNLLEKVSDDYKPVVASGFVGIFKKIFGFSWGPRLEYILRNTVLALLESEDATMLGIPRMLTEAGFRAQVVAQIKDQVIRDYWNNEFANYSDTQRNEAISPILNKVGQFLSTSTIRNIVGQPHSTFDVRQIMDEGKILIVNLSKGKIGEDNMALLGAMIITKVQLAAMSRADMSAKDRRDAFLYVDEFQNFATESFASILSEARKYGLGLVIAHQYIAQLSDEVKDAVLGNVGTMVSFRVGAPDAEALAKEFEPVFVANDMINLSMAHVYVKLLVDGFAAPAFSAITLPPKEIDYNNRNEVVAYSREHYAHTREHVEGIIDEAGGYRQKRESDEARGKAAEVLKAGAERFGPPPKDKERELPKDASFQPVASTPAIEPQSQPVEEGSSAEPEIKKEKKPHKEKPPKLMEGWVYKEVSQRGGNRWYLGETEKEFMDKKAAKEEAKKLAADSPDSSPTTEQNTNEHPEPQPPIIDDTPAQKEGGENTSQTLEIGQKIQL